MRIRFKYNNNIDVKMLSLFDRALVLIFIYPKHPSTYVCWSILVVTQKSLLADRQKLQIILH
jgi:hypothetical protein